MLSASRSPTHPTHPQSPTRTHLLSHAHTLTPALTHICTTSPCCPGEVISCKPGYVRLPKKVYRGRNAKEISVRLLEEADPVPVTRLEHANYLGREFQRAEVALMTGDEYIQD